MDKDEYAEELLTPLPLTPQWMLLMLILSVRGQ
jgi:hypothetical protein